MKLNLQKHLFSLPENSTYLNGAFMSPLLKSVEKIGVSAIHNKTNPAIITSEDFFEGQTILKKQFAQLIDAPEYKNIAIIPAVSYGIATVAKNMNLHKGDEIILLKEQFPSNVYSWKQLEKETDCVIRIIATPPISENRGEIWNESILNSISSKTKVVAIPQVHWADGTFFDLVAIREKTKNVGAYLIIDGTQSVGASPFSIKEIQPDALICSGYKWLMGPYAIGVAYYSDELCKGTPLEDSWMNHAGSENFAQLANYNYNYQPKAGRFNVGEASNFILTPMLAEGIKQLIDWKPENIQEYCKTISEEAIKELKEIGCFIENEAFRKHHLFGIYLPKHLNIDTIKQRFNEQQISVSFRGNAIRVSPNVYNTQEDFKKLVNCFK